MLYSLRKKAGRIVHFDPMACHRSPEGDGAGGGDNGDGNPGDKGGAGGGNSGGDDDKISRSELKKVLDEMHAWKKKAKDFESKQKENETNALKEQNKFKELYEQAEARAAELEQNNGKLMQTFVEEKKFGAVRAKAEALGLRPEAAGDLEMLDLEAIQVETTSTGKTNLLGVDKFVNALKTKKPHWFSDKKPPHVDTNGARVFDNDGAITAADILKAQKEGIKNGDMSKYNEMSKKFLQQRAARKA